MTNVDVAKALWDSGPRIRLLPVGWQTASGNGDSFIDVDGSFGGVVFGAAVAIVRGGEPSLTLQLEHRAASEDSWVAVGDPLVFEAAGKQAVVVPDVEAQVRVAKTVTGTLPRFYVTSAAVVPDGATGESGGSQSAITISEMLFTEVGTPGDGTYTASVDLPAGAVLTGLLYDSGLTPWSGSLVLNIGDSDGPGSLVFSTDNNAGQDQIGAGFLQGNVDSTGSPAANVKEKVYPAGDTITAVAVATLGGAPTGILRVVLYWYVPVPVNAVKAP